jgi:hypothetical protein
VWKAEAVECVEPLKCLPQSLFPCKGRAGLFMAQHMTVMLLQQRKSYLVVPISAAPLGMRAGQCTA